MQYYFDTFSLCFIALFFVQSGFVLTYAYHNQTKLQLKEFYINRFARIYPLHLLTFLVCAIYIFSSWPIAPKEKILIGLSNITLTHTLLPGMKFSLGYNSVSWFLADIAFCYLLFPLLRNASIAIISLSVVLVYLAIEIIFKLQDPINNFFPNFDFFFPLVHIAEFSVGILSAQLFLNRTRPRNNTLVECLLLLAIIMALSSREMNISQQVLQIYYILILPIFTYVYGCEQGKLSKYLANQKELVFLGKISFSLYMWHHLIMRYIGNQFRPDSNPFFAIMSAILISVTISIISFKYFECPLRTLIVTSFLRKNAQ
jgi:peptidoglycan/LPS O-acetylase OafA/YrhL